MLRRFLAARSGLARRPQIDLGGQSSVIRCAGTSSTTPSHANGKINMYNARQWVETIAPSLETFLALEKHLLVPHKFVVPYGDPAWPEKTWGYPLGVYCKNLRSLRHQGKNLPFFAIEDLEAIKFPWDMRQHKFDVFVLPGLKTYFQINEHCDMPTSFVVPVGDEAWPKILWGFKLGQTVMGMTYGDSYRVQRERAADELDKIGYSTQSWKIRQWEMKILPALETFQREFEHCNVNFNFVVPKSKEWPKAAWGIRLGAIVANMRCRKNYVDLAERDKDKLEAIGFIWSPDEHKWTDVIMPALETYHALYGTGWVSNNFVVPDEEPWPEATRGLRLGNIFMKIRHTGAYSTFVERDREHLDAIGFDFNVDFFEAVAKNAAYKY
ncbi:hypothetical protein DVH05_009386 [Phytophthora capsici]|nr:hypothetical protein DVH05_009386 [Phytophthora capsici]